MPMIPGSDSLPPELATLGQEAGIPGIDAEEYPEIIGLLEKILADEPDPQDSAELGKLIAGLWKLAANRQKETDDALGGKMSPRFMRRNG